MTTRDIAVTFYAQGNSKEPLKVFYFGYVENAISRCVYHMRTNEMGAAVATVHDITTGQLFATYTHKPGQSMRIIFEDDPANPRCIANPRG